VEDRVFLLLIAAVTLLFGWILWPFAGAILWGVIIAVMFAPVQRRLTRATGARRTPAALATVAIVVVMVILPLTLVGGLLVEEAAGLYARIRSGEWDIGRYFQTVVAALPAPVVRLLQSFGVGDLEGVQTRLSAALTEGSQFLAAQAVSLGQSTFDFIVKAFVMLYLLFFLVRDGDAIARRVGAAIPLRPEHQRALVEKFTAVIRATIKGTIVVALVQGALGGLIFWLLGIRAALLWAVVMTFLSLLPAVGAALVWFPVAAYLLATGAVWRGMVLIAYGVLVIGLVDNVLRPVLVGKDTRMPDYVVLIATLGGLAVFGANGFVLGPLVAAMFIAAWDIFSTARTRRAP